MVTIKTFLDSKEIQNSFKIKTKDKKESKNPKDLNYFTILKF